MSNEMVMMQGTAVPAAQVNPTAFFEHTRRLGYQMQSAAPITALGSSDSVTLKKTGVVAGVEVRVFGTLAVSGTLGSAAMTYEWPYNLARAIRVSANGQSNLINAPGLLLKAHNMMRPDSQDRGVSRPFGSATINQGSASLSCEDWGTSGSNTLGPGKAIPATGTYTFDFSIFVPIAFDQKTLTGAIFAQTSSTNLDLTIDWAQLSDVCTTSTATVVPTVNYAVQGIVYSIPNVGGKFVVPDLSAFHSIIGFERKALGQGPNEVDLPGTGPGRQLMRCWWQFTPGGQGTAPAVVNAANYGEVGWRYGGNDTPEVWANGTALRFQNERLFNSDLGAAWGIACLDWANEWAFRDSIDEGAANDLRILMTLVNAPTVPKLRMVTETIFGAAAGA